MNSPYIPVYGITEIVTFRMCVQEGKPSVGRCALTIGHTNFFSIHASICKPIQSDISIYM